MGWKGIKDYPAGGACLFRPSEVQVLMDLGLRLDVNNANKKRK